MRVHHLLPILSIIAGAARAEPSPNPADIYFDSNILYGGNGCPGGSARADTSADGQAITVYFDAYQVEVSSTSSPNISKSCNLSLPLHVPPGWQYSLVDVTYRGSVYLDRRVTATQTSEYYFMGSRGPRFRSDWSGPITPQQDWTFTDSLLLTAGISPAELERARWSPCNAQRNLNLRTRITVNNANNRDGFGSLANDSIDGEIKHTYSIEWRRCRS